MSFVKNPGTRIEIGGTWYVMPPLSLGTIEQLDEEKVAMLVGDAFSPQRMRFVIDLLMESLRRNYPDLQRETIAPNVDLGNFQACLQALMAVSGLTKDEDEPETTTAGEFPATGQDTGST